MPSARFATLGVLRELRDREQDGGWRPGQTIEQWRRRNAALLATAECALLATERRLQDQWNAARGAARDVSWSTRPEQPHDFKPGDDVIFLRCMHNVLTCPRRDYDALAGTVVQKHQDFNAPNSSAAYVLRAGNAAVEHEPVPMWILSLEDYWQIDDRAPEWMAVPPPIDERLARWPMELVAADTPENRELVRQIMSVAHALNAMTENRPSSA